MKEDSVCWPSFFPPSVPGSRRRVGAGGEALDSEDWLAQDKCRYFRKDGNQLTARRENPGSVLPGESNHDEVSWVLPGAYNIQHIVGAQIFV